MHARSDLAATAALAARARRWVWDVRSFWVDQRLAMGIIREGSRQERFFRAVERRAAIRSSGIITLTRRAVEEIERKYGEAPAAKATVITTCVDLERFAASALPAGPPRLLMSGTFNALYDIDLMLRFFGRAREALGADLTVLRPEPAPSDSRLRHCGAAVGTATYQDMPEAVSAHHVGLSLCRRDQPRALRGAMPTKIGEFLACGRPVVISPGIGDLDVLISASRTGVIVQGGGDGDLALACHQLKELLDDPDLPRRCRALAERHFDLARGIDSMIEVYRRSGLEV